MRWGGAYSTYSPNAIKFPETGAQIRKDYLISKGNINNSDIIEVADGRDTIYEAFAARKKAKELGMRQLLLVTSEKHMKRALFVFRRIFGDEFIVEGDSVNTGDLLISEEEKEYFKLWKELFDQLPKNIREYRSWDEWYGENVRYYQRQKKFMINIILVVKSPKHIRELKLSRFLGIS